MRQEIQAPQLSPQGNSLVYTSNNRSRVEHTHHQYRIWYDDGYRTKRLAFQEYSSSTSHSHGAWRQQQAHRSIYQEQGKYDTRHTRHAEVLERVTTTATSGPLQPLSQRAFSHYPMQTPVWPSYYASSRLCDSRFPDMSTMQAWSADAYQRPDDELAELAWALSQAESAAPPYAAERAVQPTTAPARIRAARGLINFKKTWMYANSRLPPYMPPMVIYMPTWRLLCLAAQASLSVYNRPRGEEREHFIDADWQNSTKAMVLQSRPIDDQNVIVFAIRGSQLNFADWSINFRPEPTSPIGFLDDTGNACHAGFLAVAKAMIAPVAARLRQLLEQNPSRTASSLLITGHSAGGAVAALLYAHMLSINVESELHNLTGCFKRVHCITFGAPPLTLLPLSKPHTNKKNIFMSFINEGDPIGRAEKAYVMSLLRVLAAPTPQLDKPQRPLKKLATQMLKNAKQPQVAPYWPLPAATLCNAGRVIVIRQKPGSTTNLEAVSTTDDQLRDVLFGDPAMHSMSLYKERIDQLAISAVTGANVT